MCKPIAFTYFNPKFQIIIEQLLTLEKKTHFLNLSEKQATLISGLIEQLNSYMRHNADSTWEFFKKDLLDQIVNIEYSSENTYILEIDMFSLLTSLSFFFSEIDQFLLFQLILKTHCVQILLNQLILTDENNNKINIEDTNDIDNDLNLDEILKYLNKSIQKECPGFICAQINANKAQKILKLSLLQFLRCSAIFYSCSYRLTPNNYEVIETNSQSKFKFLLFTAYCLQLG